jgi:hypothetical protein
MIIIEKIYFYRLPKKIFEEGIYNTFLVGRDNCFVFKLNHEEAAYLGSVNKNLKKNLALNREDQRPLLRGEYICELHYDNPFNLLMADDFSSFYYIEQNKEQRAHYVSVVQELEDELNFKNNYEDDKVIFYDYRKIIGKFIEKIYG